MESLNEKILTACRTELCGLYPGLNGAFALLPQKDGRILGTDGRTLFIPPDLTQMYAENPAKVRRGYLHMLLHCLFLHIRLPDRVDPEAWGLACDLWTETFIENLEQPRLHLLCGDGVADLRKKGDTFAVTFLSGERYTNIDKVILACGGAAGSKVGGVLDGYRLAKGLGHHRTALTPALVQLKTDPTYPRSLKGVKNTARITLRRGREVLAEKHGEILFTEYGVSGPAIFEISRYAIGEDVTLSLDLWPEQSEADTAAWLRRRQALALRNREFTCGQAFTGALHSRLSQMAAKYAGLSPSLPLADAPEEALAALARTCKHFDLPVTGTCGFDQAQVTAGGLRTDEFDPHTLQSRLVPGLYACGEVLDVDGDCGGYNLQWAWSSGHLAGQLR